MVKYSVILICLMAAALISGCNGSQVESLWNEERVTIDGNPADWSRFPLTSFEDESASLGIRNDKNYIYLVFLSRDYMTNQMIQRSGVTVWIDSSGQNKKEMGFRYYGEYTQPDNYPNSQRDSDSEGRPRISGFMQRRMELSDKIMIIRDNERDLVPAYSDDGVSAVEIEQTGAYSFEMRIPINNLDERYAVNNLNLGSDISFGIEIGMDEKEMKEMRERMKKKREEGGGDRGGVRGGRGGGGGRGGSGGAGRRPGGSMEQNKKIWIKVLLAKE